MRGRPVIDAHRFPKADEPIDVRGPSGQSAFNAAQSERRFDCEPDPDDRLRLVERPKDLQHQTGTDAMLGET